MGTVTVFTAARMLEIEAASVVDGEVVGDNLILTKHDGSTIDAGNVRGPSIVINVKDHGAIGNGVANDGPAIQDAIDDLPANGGVLYFPAGVYKTASAFNFDGDRSIVLIGEGGLSAGMPTATTIVYTGSAANFITANDARGFTMMDICVLYDNASFTGTLINLSTDSAHATHYGVFVRCQFAGAGIRTAAQLVLLNNAACCSFAQCVFQNAIIGIRGRLTSGDFSNDHLFTSCWFQVNSFVTACTAAMGQACEFNNCNFEALVSGAPGAYVQLVGSANGLAFIGCWFGDTSADGTWIVADGPVAGLVLKGNYISGYLSGGTVPTGKALDLGGVAARGVVIEGNCFVSLGTGVLFGALAQEVEMAANYFAQVTNRYTGTPLSGMTTHSAGNGGMEMWGIAVFKHGASYEDLVKIDVAGAGETKGLRFGVPGANDANIYWGGANLLKTDDSFLVKGQFETYDSIFLDSAGVIWFRSGLDGAGSGDTNLYRSAADTAKTDDGFIAGGGLATKTKAGIPSDADLVTGMQISGACILDTTNSRIYFRVGSTWKYAALV